MNCGRGRGARRQNPILLLLGVILLALLGEGSGVIFATAVEWRWIGRSEDRRRERISRDQLQPRKQWGCSRKGDQECPQRTEHVGDEGRIRLIFKSTSRRGAPPKANRRQKHAVVDGLSGSKGDSRGCGAQADRR